MVQKTASLTMGLASRCAKHLVMTIRSTRYIKLNVCSKRDLATPIPRNYLNFSPKNESIITNSKAKPVTEDNDTYLTNNIYGIEKAPRFSLFMFKVFLGRDAESITTLLFMNKK